MASAGTIANEREKLPAGPRPAADAPISLTKIPDFEWRKVKKYQPTERHYLDHREEIRVPRGGDWGRSGYSFPPPRKNLSPSKIDPMLQFLRGGAGGGNPNPLLMVEIMSFCGLVLFHFSPSYNQFCSS